jgi:hypothetical protein
MRRGGAGRAGWRNRTWGGPAAPYQGGSKPRRTGWSSSSASAAARRDPAAPTTEPHGPRGEPRARAGWRYAAHCIYPIFSAHRHLLDNSNGSLAVKLARPLDRATTIYPVDPYNFNGSRGTSEIGTFYPVYYKFWLGFGTRYYS